MSLSGALNNALTGLYANGRRSEIVASNVANAQTDGFRRRSLEVTSARRGDQGGVNVIGVTRSENPLLISDRRLSSAAFANQQQTANFLSRFEDLLGSPDIGSSLAGRLATFENSMITAASRPDVPERLDGAVIAAKSLAQTLNTASDAIQESRTRADADINVQVETMNTVLLQLEDVNAKVLASAGSKRDNAALLDQRQQLINQLSEIVPVRVTPRQNGGIAIYTTGGEILLDSSAAQFEYNQTYFIVPGMKVDPGVLSGLTLNGRPINTSSDRSPLRGGSLIAQFEIRDEMSVEAQAQLDAVARDLMERFEGMSADTTRAPGSEGLFTDQGNALDITNEIGLSARIEINASVDIDNGGASWRLRDGLNAVVPGDVGDATLLQAYTAAMNENRAPASGSFGTGSYNLAGLAATLASQVGTQRLLADQNLSFASAQLAELTQREYADGVDTDVELQNLMVIERAYAANARILETVDELMQLLTRI